LISMIRSATSGTSDLEQPADEVRVRPREDDLDLVARVAHVQDQAADPLAGLVLLAGDLLAAGHEALGPADLLTTSAPPS
jgi:hypothetical protein